MRNFAKLSLFAAAALSGALAAETIKIGQVSPLTGPIYIQENT